MMWCSDVVQSAGFGPDDVVSDVVSFSVLDAAWLIQLRVTIVVYQVLITVARA